MHTDILNKKPPTPPTNQNLKSYNARFWKLKSAVQLNIAPRDTNDW